MGEKPAAAHLGQPVARCRRQAAQAVAHAAPEVDGGSLGEIARRATDLGHLVPPSQRICASIWLSNTKSSEFPFNGTRSSKARENAR